MKPFVMLGMACILLYSAEVQAQDAAAEDQYFDVYSLILKADNQANKGRLDAARSNYSKAEVSLKKLQEEHPLWNPNVIKFRIDYLNGKINAIPAPNKPAIKRELSEEPVTPGNSSEPVIFKPKFKTGQRYTFTADESTKYRTDQTDPYNMAKRNQTSTDGIVISVLKDREGGGQEIEFKEVSSKVDGKDVTDDPLLGIGIKLLTDAQGKVESVEDFQELQDRVVNAAPAEVREEVRKQFTEDSLKQMGSFNDSKALPDHPVKVGDSWERKEPSPMATASGTVRLDTSSKYTFRGWVKHEGKNYAVIEATGDFSTDSSSETLAADNGRLPPGATMKELGNVTGKIWFDPESGVTVQETEKTVATLRMTLDNVNRDIHVDHQKSTKLVSVAPISQ